MPTKQYKEEDDLMSLHEVLQFTHSRNHVSARPETPISSLDLRQNQKSALQSRFCS